MNFCINALVFIAGGHKLLFWFETCCFISVYFFETLRFLRFFHKKSMFCQKRRNPFGGFSSNKLQAHYYFFSSSRQPYFFSKSSIASSRSRDFGMRVSADNLSKSGTRLLSKEDVNRFLFFSTGCMFNTSFPQFNSTTLCY